MVSEKISIDGTGFASLVEKGFDLTELELNDLANIRLAVEQLNADIEYDKWCQAGLQAEIELKQVQLADVRERRDRVYAGAVDRLVLRQSTPMEIAAESDKEINLALQSKVL